jgi:phosphate transport system substrate-binding protein
MKRRSQLIIATLLLIVGSASAGTITIKGSDTMVRLAQRWAETYMAAHADAVIQVTGGGTGSGVAALINGGTDVCQASRDMQEKEYQLAARKGRKPYRTAVALDAVAVYLNPKNRIDTLTLDQLRGIFTGVISNWNELGGEDHRIVLYSRENNSGTYLLFREQVLDHHDYAVEAQMLPGTAAVINAVAHDRYGIGYGGIAWESAVKHVWIKRSEHDPAVAPSVDNVAGGEYPISRELYWFSDGKPVGDMAALVNWVLSPDGQKVAKAAGYYPLSAEQAEKNLVK